MFGRSYVTSYKAFSSFFFHILQAFLTHERVTNSAENLVGYRVREGLSGFVEDKKGTSRRIGIHEGLKRQRKDRTRIAKEFKGGT